MLENRGGTLEALHVVNLAIELLAGAGERLLQDRGVFGLDGVGFRGGDRAFGDQLPAEDRACAEALIKTLEDYGVFIVSAGRAEKWLASLHVDASKRNWLPAMFARIGSDPDATGYVKPEAEDVWDFVRSVGRWIGNPHRKGMPA